MMEGPRYVTCTSVGTYSGSLTRGRIYAVVSHDPMKRTIRIIDDNGRKRSFPESMFLAGEVPIPRIASIHIDYSDDAAAEVLVDLSDGRRLLLWFARPDQLGSFGDILSGTDVRFHLDNRSLVIVSRLDEDVIRRVVAHAWDQDLLEACSVTLPGMDDAEPKSMGDRTTVALRAVVDRLDVAAIVDVALELDELTAATVRDAVDASRSATLLDAIAAAAKDESRSPTQRCTALWLLADPCAVQNVLAVALVAMDQRAPARVRHAALDTLDRLAFGDVLSSELGARVHASVDDVAIAARWAKVLGSTRTTWSVPLLQDLAQRWPMARADVALALSRLDLPDAKAAAASLTASADGDPALAAIGEQITADLHLRSALHALEHRETVTATLVDALIDERRFALLEKLLEAGLIPSSIQDRLGRLGDNPGWSKSQRRFARRIAARIGDAKAPAITPSGRG